MDMERKLSEMDFSSRSKVKASLWQKLEAEWENSKGSKEMSLDDLDMVAAAGVIHHPSTPHNSLS